MDYTTWIIAALAKHKTREARTAAVLNADETGENPDALYHELDMLEGCVGFEDWVEGFDSPFFNPIPGVPNLYRRTFKNSSVARIQYQDWLGDPTSIEDLESELFDIGFYGVDCNSHYEELEVIHALMPYAADAAARMEPWIDHNSAKDWSNRPNIQRYIDDLKDVACVSIPITESA